MSVTSKMFDQQAEGYASAMERVRNKALEEAAVIAENWGNAPPNPQGRRAELAAAIRAVKTQEPQ